MDPQSESNYRGTGCGKAARPGLKGSGEATNRSTWKLKKLILFSGALAVLLILGYGCKSDGRSGRSPGMIDDEETAALTDRIEQIKNVYHLCPSPAEMLSVIDMAELSFNGDILNPPANAVNYLDTKSRTLNLGVYITDLAYSALFGRHEETLDYLEAVGSVAEEIRVTGAINEELIENARTNVEYLDSLYNVSNEAFVNMLYFCEKNQRPNTIILISAGAFLESMYLAINLVKDFDNAEQIIEHLAEQKYAIDNLMLFAESLADDNNIAAIVEDMKPIKDIYDGIETGSGMTTVEKSGSNKLVIGGGSKPAMTREEFEALRDITFSLRSEITGI